MALVWFDGFEDHSTDFPTKLRYSIKSTSFDSVVAYQQDGRFADSKSIYLGSSGASTAFGAFMPTPSMGVAAGCSIKQSSLNAPTASASYNFDGLSFANDIDSDAVCVAVLVNGSIQAYRGTTPGSNILGTSVAGLISPDTWYHLGVELTRSTTTGTLNVYVDGVQVLALTGLNTYATPVAIVNICKAFLTGTKYYDDFYMCDAASWLGECRSTPLVLTGDTAQKDFTPSTGADNYACVDELPPNKTDYVSSATAGAKDRYTVTDMSYTPTAILGLKVSSVVMKDDITTRTVRNTLKSGATNANGATKPLSSSYRFIEDIFAADPNTSAAWTKSGVDAVEVGIEVVS